MYNVIERLLVLNEKVEKIKMKKQKNLTKNLENDENGNNKIKQESSRSVTS